MMTRNTLRYSPAFLIAALVTVTLLTPSATILTVKDELPQKDRLIVHEWGTFTTVSSADGTVQSWNPLIGPSELPGFVYGDSRVRKEYCPKCQLTLARMETPVLYFYADREMSVSVKVDFPEGKITEWYPQACSITQGINWEGFRVVPGGEVDFPIDQRRSHYYPARETDAAPIRVSNGTKSEHEKFLFYRGIGNFRLPLQVKLTSNQVMVRNFGRDEIAEVILFENRDGQMGWSLHGALKDEAALSRPVLGQPIDQLYREFERILVQQGLYEKEARAMVKTWKDSWFEEGLRVYYIVPRKATDAILPITITPTPTELTRIIVARAEIITPEIEREIQDAARQFCQSSGEARASAIKTVRRYGRFADPVLRQMMNSGNNTEIYQLLIAAQR